MKNTISERVADFLKGFPPFSSLTLNQLEGLSFEVSILYKPINSVVFAKGETPHEFFYVVHKGAIALSSKDVNNILDIYDEGDVFGLRPLMANENYELNAKAKEESILYAIPIKDFKPLALANPEVGSFLIQSFASNTKNPYSEKYQDTFFQEPEQEILETTNLLDFQTVQYATNVVTCQENTPIKELAKTMTENNIGSILVVRDNRPLGIITDKDLRNKVFTEKIPISGCAKQVMTTPVITYPKNLTITQAQIAMMKSDIGHLCLTMDGTPDSEVVGILSRHDIMLALGNNPTVLMRAIKRSVSIEDLRGLRHGISNLLNAYLNQNIPIRLVSKIIAELKDASVKRAIQIIIDDMEEAPPVKFAWLTMGSQGRAEQLLNTDQDNAIIYEDVPEKKREKTATYFLKLGQMVTKALNAMGYEYCPAEMMASNPLWCHSIGEWKEVTDFWISHPGPDEVLLSSIFFDFSVAFGDKSLATQLSDHIFQHMDKHPMFLTHLAGGALQNPSPSGFFRDFLVEQNGQHKDFFDLKQRVLMPFIDAARVLILSHKIKSINNTAERYEKLAELEPQNHEIYMACSYASKALLKFRTIQGVLHNDSGRFIELDKLNKEEKIKLKRTFKTLKEIQELLQLRFQIKSFLG